LLLVRDAAGVVTVGSCAKAAGIRAFSSLLRTDPAVDPEVAGARRDKDADDAAANAAAAATAADAMSKAAAAAARCVARGGIPLSSKWGAPSGVTPPDDSTADSGTGDVCTRNGAGDAGIEAHSLGPNADGTRCAATFVAADCPTPAQASALSATSRHAAASAAEHAEGKRRVATALATSAASAARAEADARQESADIQRALRISVADQAGPAHPPLIG
jgi:trimeric autotransporter adhesin